MEITPIILILVGAICLVLGFIACSLINTLGEDEVQDNEDGAQAPPGGKKGRYIPVVRLWRDKQSRTIIVEAEGKSYVSAIPLDETNRRELEMVAREFRGWLGMGINNSPTPMETPPGGLDATPKGVNTAVATEAAVVVPGSTKAKLIPRNPATSVVATEAVQLVGSKSIVMQIEDILQDLISSGPLASQGVHLSEDLTKGVIVTVGSEKYEGIDAVPDPEIKSVIRAAVAEWEKQQ